MIVVMTLNNKIIEARTIEPRNLEIEGYMQGLQNDMLENNEDIIDLSKDKPTIRFEIVVPEKNYIN